MRRITLLLASLMLVGNLSGCCCRTPVGPALTTAPPVTTYAAPPVTYGYSGAPCTPCCPTP